MIERMRAVMFDFDGTLGLFRAGWMPLMLDMMMETLGPLGPDPAILRDQAETYVARFTGKDTLHQMEPFVAQVRALGGSPLSPEEYKAEILSRIEHRRREMTAGIESGTIDPDLLLVPGSRKLLERLAARGIPLYLASGTDHGDICEDAAVLKIDHYFAGIYGSAPESLTKRELLRKIVASGIAPNRILTFGDGRVEIEETKAAGGVAVGVATDELECLVMDEKKRRWLLAAGADFIIPNYLEPAISVVLSA
ncbi:MAG: HAD family hydrolase [Terriglobia bacterium]